MMIRFKNIVGLAASAVIALPATGLAAGYQINEHNAASTGRAGATVATINDASSIFYNPAGLTGVKGTEVQLGVTLIRPSGTYTGSGFASNPSPVVTQSTKQPVVPVPNIYAARALSEKAFVGLAFYAPYGLGLEWDDSDNFVGRTAIKEISLRTFFITPAIALKLSDAVSVAVSVSLVPATLFLDRTLGAADNGQILFPREQFGTEGTVQLSGSAFGVGANAGVQVKLLENLRLGFAFRSAVGLDFSGQADFQIPDSASPLLKANFPDGDLAGELTLPHAFSLGIGWEDGPLTVEAAANLTVWSAFEELRINFESGLPSPTSFSPRNWKSVPTFRLGGQYEISEHYTARLGAAYDFSPAPDETLDPSLPDANRLIFTLGFGGEWGPIGADLAYMVLFLPEREITSGNFPGEKYTARRIDLAGITLTANF